MTSLDAIDRNSPVGDEGGREFLDGGFLVAWSQLIAATPQAAGAHSMELFRRSFRFGVALRDAQVADDGLAD